MPKNPSQVYHKSGPRKANWQNLYELNSGLLIVVPDAPSLSRLEKEIKFFLGKEEDNINIEVFPGWETLPYDHFSPYEDVISKRLSTLYQIATGKKGIFLVDAKTIMHKLPPQNYVKNNSFIIKVGEDIDSDSLRHKFEEQGYICVTKVMEHGEFAVRGSIVDVFPMGTEFPIRIDLFDTEIDTIRTFDVDTQKSLENIEEFKLLPAREFPLDEKSIERFCDSWISHFGYEKTRSGIYQDISSGKLHPGIEYYLPFFFEKTASLFDYLPSDFVVMIEGDIKKSMEHFWYEASIRYEQLRHDAMRPILAPDDIFIEPSKILQKIYHYENKLKNTGLPRAQNALAMTEEERLPRVQNALAMTEEERLPRAQNALAMTQSTLGTMIKEYPNARILFVAKTPGRREALLEDLKEKNIDPAEFTSWKEFLKSGEKYGISISDLEESLHIKENDKEILVLTEEGLGKKKIGQKSSALASQKIEAIIRDLTELQLNDPVVHIDYGVGRYLGLKKLQVDNHENEFLELEYASQAKLYVPITSLDLVSRYTGTDATHAPLNHLGTKHWDKAKREAKEKIRDTAVELLEICARRLNTKGFSFVKPSDEYERFVQDFPFEATTDQKKAIDDVISDMTTARLMDRLICGDVGFGKTEVAMRAAFLAVHNGKQVAILAPTTLLVKQHLANFEERFHSWPVRMALLSRFGGAKEQRNIVEGLADGKIDIVIGTHKLLQKNIKFKELGLLVVDEEHRFGVRQKEYIKSLTLNTDILSLTATPIPRTLNMAFSGIKDFSIISTPPARRLSIKTFVCEYEPYLVKEAILRETFRGGQVYFIYNNTATIEKFTDELCKLVPEAKIAFAHGQMRKKELENIMHDFYQSRINVLVCTTIIESGIDVPSANTIIINRADKFGLAQLHQLRGRVGRSHHQAYAYLMTPDKRSLTSDAKKRLDAIIQMKDLGTGFVLATNDLEIRGAGELLGEKQSGVIEGIGFTLYMDMLKSAIKTLKGDGKEGDTEKIETKIELKISAIIPDNYVRDLNLRLVLYKRISEAKTKDELEELKIEMIDRFGKLPEQAKNLFKITELKQKAKALDIVKIVFGTKKGTIEFKSDYKGDINVIIPLIQKHVSTYKFASSNSIEFTVDKKASDLDFFENLLTDWSIN